jgi:hypothetical protein
VKIPFCNLDKTSTKLPEFNLAWNFVISLAFVTVPLIVESEVILSVLIPVSLFRIAVTNGAVVSGVN